MKKRVFRERYNEIIIKKVENKNIVDYSSLEKLKKEELIDICNNLNKNIENTKTKKDLIELIRGE